VPLEEDGRTFFNILCSLKAYFTEELIEIFEKAKLDYKKGKLKPATYSRLYILVNTGHKLNKERASDGILNILICQELGI
jgi:hypothetical protein